MPIVYACICPHVPPEEEAPRTAAAIATVMRELGSYEPEVVAVFASPPAPGAAIGISGDEALRLQVAAEAKQDAVPVQVARRGIDDWLAPLLTEGAHMPSWLWITTARLEPRFHFEFGRALGRAAADDERRSAIVCAAGLSRALEPGTPRYDPSGRIFDEHYRRAIEGWDVKWLVHLDTDVRRRAAEDCVPQTAVLMGALGGYRIQSRVLSYEAPTGAGLLVAAIDVLGPRRAKREV